MGSWLERYVRIIKWRRLYWKRRDGGFMLVYFEMSYFFYGVGRGYRERWRLVGCWWIVFVMVKYL